jgi:hypothetical protein
MEIYRSRDLRRLIQSNKSCGIKKLQGVEESATRLKADNMKSTLN